MEELRDGEEEDAAQFLDILRAFTGNVPLGLLPPIVVGALTILSIETWLEPWLGGFEHVIAGVIVLVAIAITLWWKRRNA